MPPQTHYARSGEVNIAYQVVGDGPFDLVFVPGFISHLDLQWSDPRIAGFLEKLASFSRLIMFDKRGTGLSDPVAAPAPLEDRMDDVRAVMDAAGSERAALLGLSEGGPMSVLFAATYPDRTRALVLCGMPRRAHSRRAPRGLAWNGPHPLLRRRRRLCRGDRVLTGARHAPLPDRVLTTVMFTDIVGSTRRAASLGDARWRELVARHDELMRAELERHRGREVKP